MKKVGSLYERLYEWGFGARGGRGVCLGLRRSWCHHRSGSMTMKTLRKFLAGAFAAAFIASSQGQPVQWRVEDGGNGHWYQVTPSTLSWFDARDLARSLGADLAAVSSQSESAWILNTINFPFVGSEGGFDPGVWLGGSDASQEGQWTWSNGESWSYTNWLQGEPNNDANGGPQGEDYLVMSVVPVVYGKWNDAGGSNFGPYQLRLHGLMEWSADCDGNGVVDYGQILSGASHDVNLNSVPDECEQAACLSWSNITPAVMPPARGLFSAALIEHRGEVVMFGGGGNGPGPSGLWRDTWIYNGTTWRSYTGPGPSYRLGAAMCYDPLRGRAVLFGGTAASTGAQLADTWEWDGDQWYQIAANGPPARELALMAFDHARGKSVLVAGRYFNGFYYNYRDVWEWDGATWTRQEDIPGIGGGYGMAFDQTRNQMVIHGACDWQNCVPQPTTLVRNGTTWSIAPVSVPPARANCFMEYIPELGGVLMYGGTLGNPDGEVNEAWLWNGTNWSLLEATGSITRRQSGRIFLHPITSRATILMGWLNQTNTYLNQMWELVLNPQTLQTQPQSLPSAARGSNVSFTAQASGQATGYVWRHNGVEMQNQPGVSGVNTSTLMLNSIQLASQGVYDCVVTTTCGTITSNPALLGVTECHPSWVNVASETSQHVWVHDAAFDGINEGVLYFGGRSQAGAVQRETRVLKNGAWNTLFNQGPVGRSDHALVTLDDGTVLLFGGKAGSSDQTVLSDTWIWNGSNWVQLNIQGPPARGGHKLSYDTSRDRVVLFGGFGSQGQLLRDTWEWDQQGWQQVASDGPSARFAHVLVYDPVAGHVILFGGIDGSLKNDTWSWDGSEWSQVSASGPSPRFYAAATFDANSGHVVLHGGSGSQIFSDMWAWKANQWTLVSGTGSSPSRWTHSMTFDESQRSLVVVGGAGQGSVRYADTWAFAGAPVFASGAAQYSISAGNPITLMMNAPNASQVGNQSPFQWQRNGFNLANGGRISGARTSSLSISSAEPSDSGLYRLIARNACANSIGEEFEVTVYCPADFNQDGGIDGSDVSDFFLAWEMGDASGDVNTDGGIDGLDVDFFFNRWENGC